MELNEFKTWLFILVKFGFINTIGSKILPASSTCFLCNKEVNVQCWFLLHCLLICQIGKIYNCVVNVFRSFRLFECEYLSYDPVKSKQLKIYADKYNLRTTISNN